MDNRWARLVVFLLGDPHGLEGGERGEDGATDPDRVLALRGGDDLDLHGGRGELGELLGHAVGNAGEHGGTAREDSVGVEVLTDINVALHDGVVGGLVNTLGFEAEEGGLEEGFGAAEALVPDSDDLTVGKFIRLLELGRGGGGLHLGLKVEGDVGEFLLDIADNFSLGGGGKRVTTLGEDLHHVVGKVTASKVETEDGVGKSVTLVDGDGVGDTISGVKDDTWKRSKGLVKRI